MIRDLLKWVAPSVVTVAGGTVAALAIATPAMLETLEQKGRVALQSAGADWGHVVMSGRNLHLTGTASSDAERLAAVHGLAALDGILSVQDTVTVAPLESPYRINVSVENGTVSLFGSVPNEELRQQLLALDGVAKVELHIRSGQPDESRWRAGVDFALAQASLVDSGYFELSGLTLNAVGRASTEKALGRLQMALVDLPAGVEVGEIAVEPVRVAPYTWRAEFDGNRIAISGHAPEERVVDGLRLADVAGIPVATGLSLASGAPEGFAEQTRLLVEQLARLERGQASIVDGVSHLTGVPPSIEVAQAVSQALSGTNSIVDLSPPPVADYWIAVSRQPGGTLVFDGFVPDEATRSAFADLAGADVSFLKFGAGAPEGYRRSVDFGIELLGLLSEGRFSLSGNSITISGVAQSPTDYRTLMAMVADRLPQGSVLGEMGVLAPRAANYTFAIHRDAGGGIVLQGMVPNPAIEAELLAAAGPNALSQLTYASGEAPNFVASAEQALNFLPWLRSGDIVYDGASWSVEGEPVSAIDKGSIETEFAIRGLARSGWTLALAQPAEAPGFADPYLWSAERLPDGSFLFAGNVPAPSLQAWLKVHVGTRVADTSRISHGAPVGFADNARAATDALLALEEGRVAYDGSIWTLNGKAAGAAERDEALALAAVLELGDTALVEIPDTAPAAPYTWQAVKSADGIVLEGTVPAESLQRFLAVRAGDDVEDKTELRADAPEGFASEALQALDVLALLSNGRVGFDGVRWSAEGQALAADAVSAATTLLGTAAPRWRLDIKEPVPEVAQAENERVTEPQPEPPQPASVLATSDSSYRFSATRAADGTVSLSGQVPAEATLRYVTTTTGASADALTVSPGAPDGFARALQAGVQALLQLQQGELQLADGTWSLVGDAGSREDRMAIEGAIAALGANWSLDLTAPSGLAQCQARLAELSSHNAILFQSGAAIIAAGASAELDAFAQALLLCPEADVEVEGHTDSDGDDRLNMALSVARAEAVVNALVERGVAPDRLYAIGYGETQPVADNETSDGKRQNRRIVVAVRDPGVPG